MWRRYSLIPLAAFVVVVFSYRLQMTCSFDASIALRMVDLQKYPAAGINSKVCSRDLI